MSIYIFGHIYGNAKDEYDHCELIVPMVNLSSSWKDCIIQVTQNEGKRKIHLSYYGAFILFQLKMEKTRSGDGASAVFRTF
jgi:hypothetical protein